MSLLVENICPHVFQVKVMAIYWATQWILAYGIYFIRVSIVVDSQAAIRSLSEFVHNFKIVGECRRYLDLLFGHFTSVSLLWALDTVKYLESIEPTSSLRLACSFRNSPLLN